MVGRLAEVVASFDDNWPSAEEAELIGAGVWVVMVIRTGGRHDNRRTLPGTPSGARPCCLTIVEGRADLDLEWPLLDSSPLDIAHAPALTDNGSVLLAVAPPV